MRVCEHLTHGSPRQHLLHPLDPAAGLVQLGEGTIELGGDLRGVGCSGQQQHLGVGIELLRSADQVDQALLPGDPADERDDRPVPVDAEGVDHVGGGVRLELLRVDSVLDHVDLVVADERVRLLDVVDHRRRHRDHGVRLGVGGLLDPGADPVAATQLLNLPGPVGLQRVRRHDGRDVLVLAGDDSGELRVPGVGVDHVDLGDRGRHGDVRAERPKGAVRPGREVLRMCRRPLPRFAHALHVDGLAELLKLRDELPDVNAGAAVDVGRILTGEDGYAQ